MNLDAQTSAELTLDTSSCGEVVQTREFVYDASTDGIIKAPERKSPGGSLLPPYSIRISELQMQGAPPQ